jgi:hypothetical protein
MSISVGRPIHWFRRVFAREFDRRGDEVIPPKNSKNTAKSGDSFASFVVEIKGIDEAKGPRFRADMPF